MNKVKVTDPYLIFLGSETNPTYAKTGFGIADWQPEKCVGQFHLPQGTVDLGLDIAAGVHTRLADQPELAEAAKRLGRTLTGVRVPPKSELWG